MSNLWNTFEDDREMLDKQYVKAWNNEESFERVENLKNRVMELADTLKGESHPVIKAKCFDYISERVFDPNEFSILQHAYSYILGGNGLMRYCCSSVCSGYHKDSGLFYEVSVNDDGYIVYLPSPYKSQIAA